MSQIINLNPISKHIQTSYHIKNVTAVLDHIQAEIFKKQRSPLEILEKEVPLPLCESLKELAKWERSDLTNSVQANMFFSGVRDAILKVPILTITLTMPPTPDVAEEINNWIVSNVKGFTATDFIVDEALIAGTVIGYNGKSREYSIRKKMQESATVHDVEMVIKNKE